MGSKGLLDVLKTSSTNHNKALSVIGQSDNHATTYVCYVVWQRPFYHGRQS